MRTNGIFPDFRQLLSVPPLTGTRRSISAESINPERGVGVTDSLLAVSASASIFLTFIAAHYAAMREPLIPPNDIEACLGLLAWASAPWEWNPYIPTDFFDQL